MISTESLKYFFVIPSCRMNYEFLFNLNQTQNNFFLL